MNYYRNKHLKMFENQRFFQTSTIVDVWKNRPNSTFSNYLGLSKARAGNNVITDLLNMDKKWIHFLDYLWGLDKSPPSNASGQSFYQRFEHRFYISKQKAIQKHLGPPKSPKECVNLVRDNSSQEFGIGVNLTRFTNKDRFVVCDVDNSYVGQRILDLVATNTSPTSYFRKVFGNPVVIETPSTGHLHLWYKSPPNIPNKNKIKACSRLGVCIEYTFENIELYSQNRNILYYPSNNSISELAPALYPYNYFHRNHYKSLTEGPPLSSKTHPNSEFIPIHARNNNLFRHFRVDNFNAETVLIANKILCEEPLTELEVLESCENRYSRDHPHLNINPPKMRKSTCVFMPESLEEQQVPYRIPPDDDTEEVGADEPATYDNLRSFMGKQDIARLMMYEFSPFRAKNAIERQTPTLTMFLTAFLEKQFDTFYERSMYEGKQPESVVISIFLDEYQNKDRILYETERNRWYKYNGKFWDQCEPEQIDSYLQQFLSKHINFGGLENRFTRGGSYRSLLQTHVSRQFWPKEKTIGLPFLNGVIIANQKNQWELKPHSPHYYHRSLLPCNYNQSASLSILQVRFLLDLCGEQMWNANVLRFIFYLIVSAINNQVGVYLNSEPGGSKSTFVRLIQIIFRQGVIPLNVDEIKKGSLFQSDYAAGSRVLVISEMPRSGTNHETVRSYAKSKLGGDPESAAKKHGKFYQTSDIPVLIFVSNHPASEMPFFEDDALKDRVIDFRSPMIDSIFKHHDIEKYVAANLEGLLNWIIQLPINMINRFIRTKDLNAALRTDHDPMMDFCAKELALVPNALYNFHKNSQIVQKSKLDMVSILFSHADLEQAFKQFLNDNAYSESILERYKSYATIKNHFNRVISNQIPKRQRDFILEGRNSDARGFFHVTTKTRLRQEARSTFYGKFPRQVDDKSKTQYTYIGRKQYNLIEPFDFTENTNIIDIIGQDSFAYEGIVTHQEGTELLVQTKPNPENDSLRESAYKAIGEVATTNCKTLLTAFPQQSPLPYNENKMVNGFQNQALALAKTTDSSFSELELEESRSAIIKNYQTKGPLIYETRFFQETALSSPVSLNKDTNQSNLNQAIYQPSDPRSSSSSTTQSSLEMKIFYHDFDKSSLENTHFFSLAENNCYPLPVDSYVIKGDDPLVYNTPFNSTEDILLKITIRLALKIYIFTTKTFPTTLIELMCTVFFHIMVLRIYPVMLLSSSTWYTFIVQEFPMFKPVIDNWYNNNEFELGTLLLQQDTKANFFDVYKTTSTFSSKEAFDSYCQSAIQLHKNLGVDPTTFSFDPFDQTTLMSSFSNPWSNPSKNKDQQETTDNRSIKDILANYESQVPDQFKTIENSVASDQKLNTNTVQTAEYTEISSNTPAKEEPSIKAEQPKKAGRPKGSKNKPKETSREPKNKPTKSKKESDSVDLEST